MVKLIRKYKQIIIILCISTLYSLFLLSGTLTSIIKTPKETVNMMVGHYYEDYYEYIAFVKQGGYGNIIFHNPFTNDDKGTLFVPWWPLTLTGFIYSLILKLPASLAFWISSFINMIVFFVLSFKAIDLIMKKCSYRNKLFAFMLSLISSSYFSLENWQTFKINIYNNWTSIGFPFTRYNIGTPQHQLANIIYILSIIILAKVLQQKINWKTYGWYFSLSLVLLLTRPINAVVLWFAIFLSLVIENVRPISNKSLKTILFKVKKTLKESFPLYFLSIITLLIFLLLIKLLNTSQAYQNSMNTEIHNFRYPAIKEYLLSVGIILPLAILGLPYYLKHFSFMRLVFLITSGISIFMLLVPIQIHGENILSLFYVQNLRFNNPLTYVFLGTCAVEPLRRLGKGKVFYLAVILVLLFNIPSLFIAWREAIVWPNTISPSYLQFMPNDMYKGIKNLENSNPNKIILTSLKSKLGMMVPSISGCTVFLGINDFTLNMNNKVKTANQFFSLEMDQETAKKFLSSERISEILITKLDGRETLYLERYPFLSKTYSSDNLIILSYQ